MLVSSGLSKFSFSVLKSWLKSKLVYSHSNSVSWVKLSPFKASFITWSLVLEVGRLSVVKWVGDRAVINLMVVTVVVRVVVDVDKALSISTGNAKKPLSIKVKRVLNFEFECLGKLVLRIESQVF